MSQNDLKSSFPLFKALSLDIVHTLLFRRPKNTTAIELRRFPFLFESLFPPKSPKPNELRLDVFVGFWVMDMFE